MVKGFTPQFHECTNVGKRVKTSKKRYTWKYKLDDQDFTIDLYVSRLSGKRKVMLNGEIKFNGKKSGGVCFSYAFKTGKHTIAVFQIQDQGGYDLRVDNQFFSEQMSRSGGFNNQSNPSSGGYNEDEEMSWGNPNSRGGFVGSSAAPQKQGFGGPSGSEGFDRPNDPWSNQSGSGGRDQWEGSHGGRKQGDDPWKYDRRGSDELEEVMAYVPKFKTEEVPNKPRSKTTAQQMGIKKPEPAKAASPPKPAPPKPAAAPSAMDLLDTVTQPVTSTAIPEDLFIGGPPQPASNDPFGASPVQSSDPFGTSPQQASNPFGASPQASDPFGASPPQVSDPFGAAPAQPDMFGGPPAPAMSNPAPGDMFGGSSVPSSSPFGAAPSQPAPNDLGGLVDLNNLHLGNDYSPIVAQQLQEANKPVQIHANAPNVPMNQIPNEQRQFSTQMPQMPGMPGMAGMPQMNPQMMTNNPAAMAQMAQQNMMMQQFMTNMAMMNQMNQPNNPYMNPPK